MKLKIKYALWILALHTLLAITGYYAIKTLDKPFYIFALEGFILVSLVLSIWFYSKFRLPKNFIKFGKQIIQEDDFNIQYLKTDNEQLNELYEVFNGMIEKISLERRFSEEQNHFLKDVLNASPVGLILLDLDNKIESFNPKAKSCLWLSNSDIGLSLKESKAIVPFNLDATEAQVINLGGAQKIKYAVSSFYYRGFHRKMLTISDLQKEILEAEKASYSKVIRMMAHEINNSIGPINSILNTVKDEYPNDELINDVLATAIGRTESLNNFMQNFANVVRLPDPILEFKDLRPTIDSALKLLQSTFDEKDIRLNVSLSDSVKLKIDTHQIEQVIINILRNSVDAIGNKGEIKIELTQKYLAISDSGIGFTKEQQEMLFTPFFTTKPTGQGIGLTIIQRILVGHHFNFSLESKDGWTTFLILFAPHGKI